VGIKEWFLNARRASSTRPGWQKASVRTLNAWDVRLARLRDWKIEEQCAGLARVLEVMFGEERGFGEGVGGHEDVDDGSCVRG